MSHVTSLAYYHSNFRMNFDISSDVDEIEIVLVAERLGDVKSMQ